MTVRSIVCLLLLLFASSAVLGADELRGPDTQAMAGITAAVAAEIADRHLAGAVVLVGDAQGVRYRIAEGTRTTAPAPEAMTADTIFDLASLTKAVATATAIMQLAERGRLALDAPAARYWPAFAAHRKDGITVRELLAHTSGLPAGVSSARALRTRASVIADIVAMPPVASPGVRVIYSDINYVVLGEIVARVSGEPLDAWCAAHVFAPLHMRDTQFRPGARAIPRIAPTSARETPVALARVNDPIAAAMGGVSGNAGLLSTADDLARFARMLLHDGALDGRRILRPSSVAMLEAPATLDAGGDARTAGWALQPPLAANRYRLPAAGTLAHLGYTGTGLWIDLVTRRFVIVLTSRLYPDATGDARPLRAQVLGIVSSGETGLGWVPPSPNLRDAVALSLYPDVGMVEGADVSVGRGTVTPFGVVGAPWIDGRALADDLRAMHVNAEFAPTRFVPAEGTYRGALCEGVRIVRLPGAMQPGAVGYALALALHRRYPDRFRIDAIRASVGSRAVADMLEAGRPLDAIERVADAQSAAFVRERAAYLLY
ncbi:conserved exported protein of unknown function [Burkholderia multivorans]